MIHSVHPGASVLLLRGASGGSVAACVSWVEDVKRAYMFQWLCRLHIIADACAHLVVTPVRHEKLSQGSVRDDMLLLILTCEIISTIRSACITYAAALQYATDS